MVGVTSREASGPAMQGPAWHVAGSYFEACNCQTSSPRWRRGGVPAVPASTSGVCDFALSWQIAKGEYGGTALHGLGVVMAGSYRDDEPGRPWRVCLYVDQRATPEQYAALSDIFTGRAGGTVLQNYAGVITEIYSIRRAHIELDHRRRHWSMRADSFVIARAAAVVESPLPVSSGVAGYDSPGEQLRTDMMQVYDSPLIWGVQGRCGFAASFAYHSECR